jgi:glycosyltransferase involved in cell wall biosynthesis
VIVGIDGTPLLGTMTGVGRYTAGLLSGLSELGGTGRRPEADLVLTAFTWRGAADLDRFAGRRVTVKHRRLPARGLQAAWRRFDFPPAEWLCGVVDVFHGTNFTLPPLAHAAGVLTVHDLAFLDHPETVRAASLAYRDLVPRGLARARAVCAPTRTVADRLIQRYALDPAAVVVTPNGLSDQWLNGPEPATAEWLAARGLPASYVLFVGTSEPRKNLPVLIAAHAQVPSAPPLVLAGPPGWGPQPVTEGVCHTGYLGQGDLARVMARARCLVLPSRDEGFGLPALEALACGVPVIVSDLPVLREVLGAEARYVPVDDVAGLAEALVETLAEDPEAAAAQRRRHAARFTWRAAAETALHAYAIATATR